MQRPNMADLFTANGSSTGSNWVASNIANIGYNWSKWHPWEGGYEVWFSRWYVTKDSAGFHKPYVAMAVYPYTGSGQYWESYIGYDNNTKKLKFTGPTGSNPQDTPASWSIGGNVNENPNNTSGQVPWTDGWREDYNFSPYEKVLLSGNGQAFSNSSHWEQIVHYVERQETNSASSIGCEWIRTRANIKPQNAVSYIKSGKDNNTAGTIKNDTLNVNVDFDWSGTGYPTDYKIEFKASGVSTITKYQSASVRRYDNGWDRYHLELPITDFTPDKDYSITITPIVRIRDNFNTWHEYYYSNVSKTVANFVKRDPRPSASGLTIALKKNNTSVAGTKFGIVRDFDLTAKKFTIDYVNSNSGGRANSCIVRLINDDGRPSIFFPNWGTTHSLPYSDQIPMDKVSVPFGQYYKMEIVFWHSSTPNYTTTVVIDEFIDSRVRPMFNVTDLQCSIDNGLTWSAKNTLPSILSSDTLKFKWSFDGATNGTEGLANTVLIKISDKNDSSVYKNVWCGATNDVTTGNSTKSVNTSLRTPPTECTIKVSDLGPALIGVSLKLEITPYFLYKYYYDSGIPYVYGIDTYTLTTSSEINLGLKEIKRIAPFSSTSSWFKGNVAEGELPKFRIAFELPEDTNYAYLDSAGKNAYRYSSLYVHYHGNSGTSVEKTYQISDNMTDPEHPTWICITGDGELRHKKTVIIDLTGINLSVDDTVITIEIIVQSQYGSIRSIGYTINIVDFPLILSEDEGGIKSGDLITKDSFNTFFTCKSVVDTFLNPNDVTVIEPVLVGALIKYDALKSLVDPINTLQNYTSGSEWSGNLKVYSMPRAISKNGSVNDDVPFYQKKQNDLYDHIYTIVNAHTDLTQLSTLPSDYSDKYDKYLQKDKDYAFRSTNNNVPVVGPGEDLPLYSAAEYNVIWSYYMLYRKLHTSTRFADRYLIQSTKIFASTDTPTYGGWVSIPDVQLRNDYTYALDVLLTPPMADRLWTIFGGSYGEIGGVKQGLFISTNVYEKLKVFASADGLSTYGTEQEVDVGVRKTYTIEGVSGDETSVASSVNSYSSTNTGGYVAVADKEIYSDYTFVVSLNVKEMTFTGRFWTFLGCQTTTKEILYTNYPKGVFLGVNNDYGRVTYKKVGAPNETSAYEVISYVSVTSADEGVMKEYTLQGNGEHTQLSSGGFYLMNALNASTGTPVTADYQLADAFYNRAGAIGEIKVYDADNNLIMDFVPETSNGNIGFRDMVDDTFYPANDNSKFLFNSPQKTTNGFMILAPKDYALEDGKILGEYMKIDSLYGDYGRFFGLEIYDGSELLHKFIPTSGKCPYIKPINPDENDSVGGFIPILTNETNMQLNYGDVFIFDFEPHTEVGFDGSSTGCFIGGSIINDHGAYAYDRYWGIHVGYRYYQSNTTLTLAISSYRDNGSWSNYVNKTYVSDTRQIMSFTMQNLSPDPSTDPLRTQEPRTDGGFFLFGYREFDTGNAQNGDNFVRCLTAKRGGKFYRITVKKSDGSLKYDFVPESNGSQIGMRDLVTDTFYPANDSSLFEYGEDDYYGVTDKVTGKFYNCNDNSKFYLLKEGEEPPALNVLLMGTPDDSEDEPEDTPDGEE